AQSGSLVTININDDLGAIDKKVRRHILETVQGRHPVLDNRRPMIHLLRIGCLKGELVQTLAQQTAGADKRRVLQKRIYSRNGGELFAQVLDDLIHMRTLRARLEMHKNPAIVP